MIDKSRFTIQRPENCPEWAEIGLKVMVRDNESSGWRGPYVLWGWRGNISLMLEFPFQTENGMFKYAEPYIKWKPEPGEWCAFWEDGDDVFVIGRYDQKGRLKCFSQHGRWFEHAARLVDDEGNLIDIRCTVEELKERTEWL